MNKITVKVAMEVASHEAVIRQAYKDSVGVWTWSVGLTNATGHDVERYIGNPQPMQHCLEIFIWALEKYADKVNETFKGHNLSEAQFAAALSFHWNTGAISRASWVKRWKAGDIPGARKAFMSWNKPPEIKKRREKERDLFFDGKWSNNGKMAEYTKLTSNKTPVWGSRVERNVANDIEAIINKNPVKTPANPAKPERKSFWARLLGR